MYRYIGGTKAAKVCRARPLPTCAFTVCKHVQVGALAALYRSVTPFSLATTHTGMGVNTAPCAAITPEDAVMLQTLQDNGHGPIVLELHLSSTNFSATQSWNTVAELKVRLVVTPGFNVLRAARWLSPFSFCFTWLLSGF